MFDPEKKVELWFCSDCMYVEEIGDLEGDDDEDKRLTEVARAGPAGLRQHGSLFNDHDEDRGFREFSWSSCDCCRSRFGGSRYRYAFWPKP